MKKPCENYSQLESHQLMDLILKLEVQKFLFQSDNSQLV
ncbi:hypothetical protein RV13_GL002518 [Enterococcus raffinosus]|nr:hypothetical protein RV13_GL002518 [Enterococcus raffinosus]